MERPIEKMLRECAGHERKAHGPAPAMDSATKRLLRTDVAKRYEREEPSGESFWKALFGRPAWAFGIALLLLTAVAGTITLSFTAKRGTVEMAKSDDAKEPPDQKVAVGIAREIAGNSAEADSRAASANASSAVATGTMPQGQADLTDLNLTPAVTSVAAPTAAASTPAAPQVAQEKAVSNSVASPVRSSGRLASPVVGGNTAFYVNTLATNAAGKLALTAVMSSFQVEQRGMTIRIVEKDGSVYSGTLQPVLDGAVNGTNILARSRLGFEASKMFVVTATGLNRSLGQRVTFSGQLAVETNAPTAPRSGRREARDTAPGSGVLTRSRIIGDAVVESGGVMHVEAAAGKAW